MVQLREPPYRVKEPDYLNDPGFLAYQATHFAPGGETYPEYLVWWWLTTKRGYEEYIDFQMYPEIGPFRPDSLLGPRIMGGRKRGWLEVYGVVFHSAPVRRGPESLEADAIRRSFALSNGFEFIRVKDTDIRDRLDYTMSHAVLGIEIAHFNA